MATPIEPHQQRILIIDFGAQYARLIGRAVRELGVYCEIFPWDAAPAAIAHFAPQGIILSGGPASAYADDTPAVPAAVFQLQVPVLGICYGMQAMVEGLGGRVEQAGEQEYGAATLHTRTECALIGAAGQELTVWMSHGDRVTRLPPGFAVVGSTDNSPFAAIADQSRHYYGVQFHPEVTHTPQGRQMLSRFAHTICGCAGDWVSSNIVPLLIERVRRQVGTDRVVLGLSGGVDSSVVAALLARAIGDQLTCIFVDTGLLRLDEGDQVMATFADRLGVTVRRVDAQQQFLQRLAGVADPERKRKIIGNLFVEIFEQQAGAIDGARWLAQGTIYPDVIESAAAHRKRTAAIKSHHNVGGLPAKMNLKLLEPLRDLFKDEVRRIGQELGLPEDMIQRHPFPGPGLGVRILGEVKKEYADLLRQADAIFLQELHRHDLYRQISQAFAVFLPVKSVGVVGDNRSYAYVIALRAVETVDFMTATWAQIPYPVLAHISSRIINEVRGVSRVTYDISGKPPATIEWE